MKIRLNEDEAVVKMIQDGLKEKGGYCPRRREISQDTKCMCKEFRDQIKDPDPAETVGALDSEKEETKIDEGGKEDDKGSSPLYLAPIIAVVIVGIIGIFVKKKKK